MSPSPPPSPAVAAAVRGVPGVSRMSTGPTDQFRSYLPGGHTVDGVRFDDGVVFVNVVAMWGVSLPELAGRIRVAVAPWVDGRDVLVAVDDLDIRDDADGDVADDADRDVAYDADGDP